jgi:hypothetical protein
MRIYLFFAILMRNMGQSPPKQAIFALAEGVVYATRKL